MGLLDQPYIGNHLLAAQGRRAGVGKRRDIVSGPVTAFAGGLLGTAPDEQGGSVLDPDSARNSPNAALAGFGLGGLLQIAPMVKALISLKKAAPAAFRSGRIGDPKPQPQRTFDHDYPSTGTGDGGSRLTHDIDGRALSARHVIGRQTVGGLDVPASSGTVDEIARLLGAQGQFSKELGSDLGQYIAGSDANGNALRQILLSNKLTENQLPHVMAHETGHLIDDLTFGRNIPLSGVRREAQQMYSDLNSSMYVRNGKIGAKPEDFGYSGKKVDQELVADAIRAYLRDPNYIKTVAPSMAKRIREHVNANPNLRDVVQFNSAAGGGLLGAAGMREESQ